MPRNVSFAKFFFSVCCTSLVVSIVCIQLINKFYHPTVDESLVQEVLKNVGRDYRYYDIYRKTSRLPKNFKYILLWTRDDFEPFDFLGKGQRAFLANNCSVTNCYVTSDRMFFGGNTTKFDAIAFTGRNMQTSHLPKQRSYRQKFIFFDMESADNYPVCSPTFDGFFNWTSTYRLDSDVPYPYILIRNTDGEVVGPKLNMRWIKDMSEVDEDFSNKLQNKSKAVAWFVSNCNSRSGRNNFVSKLQKELKLYGHEVDIYGKCGPLKCSKDKKSDCNTMLEKDYYFYLSFENSFAKDYVTEKLLTALHHDVVPIVLGGANYSRFVPPGSYIDGLKHSIKELAILMDHLIKSPKLYRTYFRWRNHYTYHYPAEVDNVCTLCESLNDNEKIETVSVYHHFRSWWHPYYIERCGALRKLPIINAVNSANRMMNPRKVRSIQISTILLLLPITVYYDDLST